MNPEQPMADVRDMYMAHTMMRREFTLLPQAVRGVAEGAAAHAEVVGAHIELVSGILHMHHDAEDLYLWPLLHERGGDEAGGIVPTMEGHHRAIDAARQEVSRLLPDWRATGRGGALLADALENLRAVLVMHMTLEETRLLPLAEKYVTEAEWAQLGEHGMASTPKAQLPLAMGMIMYEGDPATIRSLLVRAPLAARLVIPILGPRLYAKHARQVYGTSTPPKVGNAYE